MNVDTFVPNEFRRIFERNKSIVLGPKFLKWEIIKHYLYKTTLLRPSHKGLLLGIYCYNYIIAIIIVILLYLYYIVGNMVSARAGE